MLVKQFSTFNIAHLSKFIVNFNIIMIFKTQMHCCFNGFFCSVMAGGTSHFYSFYPVNVLARAAFWYDNFGLRLGKPSQSQKPHLITNSLIYFSKDRTRNSEVTFLVIVDYPQNV